MYSYIKTDCWHFNGYKPCEYHKKERVHCDNCRYYKRFNKNILIIKLQAAGEVIRNTPLLHKINEQFPDSKIYWLTRYPDLVPDKIVYKKLPWNSNVILFLMNQHFDVLYCLDKDMEACSLANLIKADIKKGFSQKDGIITIFDDDAHHKWETGIFDDFMEKNTKNYVEELFEMCGFKWNGEEYILPDYIVPIDIKTEKKIIGINTGVGKKWITRKFSENKIISLINELKRDYEIILLGGHEEEEENKKIASVAGVKYFGIFPINEFIGLVSLCNLIITPVTLTLHIAIGLKKKIILLNNIFPSNEFHLYGLGKILEPDIPCKYCYKLEFDSECYAKDCMDLIENKRIIKTVIRLL